MKIYSIRNVREYFIGYGRYWAIRLGFSFVVRKRIREQIAYRLKSARKECLKSGSCVMCGCACPALQYADKACDGDCYPKMLSKRNWNRLKGGLTLLVWTSQGKILWELRDGRFYGQEIR